MNADNIFLIKPTIELESEFLSMVEEYEGAGERFHIHENAQNNFVTYLTSLREMSEGINLQPGIVPMDTFWMVKDNQKIIGECRLRKYLTPTLEFEGGHIGYLIRPSQRQKGYGTLILALTLEKARELGIKRVRVTCDTDNLPSARIIEKNGGILSGKSISKFSSKLISQYWID